MLGYGILVLELAEGPRGICEGMIGPSFCLAFKEIGLPRCVMLYGLGTVEAVGRYMGKDGSLLEGKVVPEAVRDGPPSSFPPTTSTDDTSGLPGDVEDCGR